MRYPRPKHSIALAAIAAAVVASPFAVIASNAGPPAGDTRLVDNKQKIANTEIEQVPLRELPAAIVDVASSGLGAAGVKLPPIDPDAFPVPDLTVPLPKGLVPTTGESSAPSASGSRTPEATTTSPDSLPRTKTRSVPDSAPTSTTSPPVTTMRDGREVGAAVTHIVREDPIKMVAFTWDRPVDVDLKLRARQPDGTWSPWTVLEQISKGGVPTADKPAGTEPVWVGDAREVQVAASKDGLAIPAAETQGGDLAQLAVGSASEVVTKLAETALNTLKATLISPEGLLSLGSSLLSPLTGGPQVVARQQWGADEGIRCSQPVYSPQLKGAIVHHTAGSNDYTPAQSIEIVRGIYAYHAQSLNWCDIGYNVLVDKYGQIFEGAFGGLDRNVEGTHTGGFNKDTVGLSFIGNLEEVPPTAAAVAAAGRFLRWRLGKAGLNPAGTATLMSEGFAGTKFAAGTQSSLPMISGHRDYNSTSCPGVHGYAALAQVRALAGGAAAPAPESTPPAEPGAPESAPAPTPEQAPAPAPEAAPPAA
ncbi:peptidoglycan recognition protein family protein [Gordonia amicalis]|uniref:N-acetylmuramoyl-L-alanine amidase n=1 Tax=Gordonia amicalis TaxID=89053 RepID=A0ABU4DD73_9ACTN|nr:N-acetylmuramoyl-L-alanine amidase [Gordonia amicalis]MDV6307695.1 N-acetylmuramoyl-L-alanine amidase [Gordonia amicalis]UKO92452.1 N-acetylmuramoyl-L-alanine amidase [Gordonia amicalis]